MIKPYYNVYLSTSNEKGYPFLKMYTQCRWETKSTEGKTETDSPKY
jgi:hypothetical protein